MAILDSNGINHNQPQIMYIDLNSAFATIEQQANPLLRGRPIAVAAYMTPNACILAPSIEAKWLGLKTGMRVREGRSLAPDLVVLTPDPKKYFYVHKQLRKLLSDYTPDFDAKSIDEFVVNFTTSRRINKLSLLDIATQIKHRIRSEVGDYMRVNIGIAPNRFLAKTAASLHKPDGLDVIDHTNLESSLAQLHLTDLNGIAHRYQARLNAADIFTPLDFLAAPRNLLVRQVFKSVVGHHWYLRLRGWEVDDITFDRKSYGSDYAIKIATADKRELSRFIMKLCEKTGRRLRRAGYYASGLHIWCMYSDHTTWHKGMKRQRVLYSTQDIYTVAIHVFNQRPDDKMVAKLGMACYGLRALEPEQLELFSTPSTKQRVVAKTLDRINDRFGEFTITAATMMGMHDLIIERVPFGSTGEN